MSAQNQTKKLTFGAAGSALIVILLALSNVFPSLDLTLSAIAAVLIYVLLIEFGYPTALLSYVVSGVLSAILLPDKNASLFFLFLFGWYPFLRTVLGKSPVLISWLIKLVCAAGAGGLFWFLFSILFPMPSLAEVFEPIVIIMFLAAFVLYEIGLGRLVLLYHNRFRTRLFRT